MSILLFILCVPFFVQAATYQTPNFSVTAVSQELAQTIGDTAERFRKKHAEDWTGQALPDWTQPCPIRVEEGANLGTGGATQFVFDRGQVFGWSMSIQGSREGLLKGAVPHEVLHTVFATYFKRPVPRWADEGAALSTEYKVEQRKFQLSLVEFLKTGRGISFGDMFGKFAKEYPTDILPLYAQGHSLTRFLLVHGGRRNFVAFIKEGLETADWPEAIRNYYGVSGLGALQNTWLEWVKRGSPESTIRTGRAP